VAKSMHDSVGYTAIHAQVVGVQKDPSAQIRI
jgi:hypothetical protein